MDPDNDEVAIGSYSEIPSEFEVPLREVRGGGGGAVAMIPHTITVDCNRLPLTGSSQGLLTGSGIASFIFG